VLVSIVPPIPCCSRESESAFILADIVPKLGVAVTVLDAEPVPRELIADTRN